MSRPPLDSEGAPPVLLHSSAAGPPTPEVPSLVPDVDSSSYTVSPAPPQSRAHVPPADFDFPRPTAPSTASSHRRKRAHDDDAASQTSSPSKVSATSSDFPRRHRDRLRRDYGGCTICGVRHFLHAAHVFERAGDSNFESYQRRGLIGIDSLADYENAIFLCPADHAAYDADHVAALVVVPKYLEHFVEQEEKWQAHMTGTPQPRARPRVTAIRYAEYCEEQLRDSYKGPVYTAYPLLDYKVLGTVERKRDFTWHGDPGAVLYHARKLPGLSLALDPEPAHMAEVVRLQTELFNLSKLYDRGDRLFNQRLKEASADPSNENAGPGAGAGTGAGASSSADAQPPPPPPPANGRGSGQGASYPPFPNNFLSLSSAPRHLEVHGLKRQRTPESKLMDGDSTCAPVIPTARKRARPMGKVTVTPMWQEEKDEQPCRWGGPERSTEETVRYWNAIFGSHNVGLKTP